MRRTIESGERYYAVGQHSVYDVLTFARRAVTLLSWLAALLVAAAVFAYARLLPDLTPAGAVVIGVLLFIPPLALLHFALVLRLLRLRFDPFEARTWERVLTLSRLARAGLLLNPVYWSSVVVLGLASLIVVPFAVVLALV